MSAVLYGIRTTPTGYRVLKYDQYLNFMAQYDMRKTSRSVHCSCPAANRPDCRHRQMIQVFLHKHRLDQGWFYEYDKQKWHKPLPVE